MKEKNSPTALPMTTRSKLQDKNLVFQLAKELKEYLQGKLKQRDDGIYCCSSSDPNDWSRCWGIDLVDNAKRENP